MGKNESISRVRVKVFRGKRDREGERGGGRGSSVGKEREVAELENASLSYKWVVNRKMTRC